MAVGEAHHVQSSVFHDKLLLQRGSPDCQDGVGLCWLVQGREAEVRAGGFGAVGFGCGAVGRWGLHPVPRG